MRKFVRMLSNTLKLLKWLNLWTCPRPIHASMTGLTTAIMACTALRCASLVFPSVTVSQGISGRRHAPETRGGHLSPQAITHRTTLYPTGMRV